MTSFRFIPKELSAETTDSRLRFSCQLSAVRSPVEVLVVAGGATRGEDRRGKNDDRDDEEKKKTTNNKKKKGTIKKEAKRGR